MRPELSESAVSSSSLTFDAVKMQASSSCEGYPSSRTDADDGAVKFVAAAVVCAVGRSAGLVGQSRVRWA